METMLMNLRKSADKSIRSVKYASKYADSRKQVVTARLVNLVFQVSYHHCTILETGILDGRVELVNQVLTHRIELKHNTRLLRPNGAFHSLSARNNGGAGQ